MAEGKQIASLFALLGFQIDDKNLLKFKLGMVAAVGAVAKFAADVVRATIDLDNFNKTTGISIDLVRDWQIIAEQSNVSADSITSAFESIAKMKGDLMAGKNIGSAWAMLGITGNEDPEYIFNKVLEELGKIEDINLRNTRIADLGFDPQLVNLIGKTRESLDGMFKDLRLTEKERKNLLEVKKSFTDLRLMLSMLKEKFVALFFPIKMFIDLATRIYMIIYKVVDKTIGWEKAVRWLGIVFAGLLAIFAPVTFALTALALAIEDVWGYFHGKDSYTKDFINWFKEADLGIQTLIVSLGVLAGSFATAFAVSGIISWSKSITQAIKTIDAVFRKSKWGRILLAIQATVGLGVWLGKWIKERTEKRWDEALERGEKSGDRVRRQYEKYNRNRAEMGLPPIPLPNQNIQYGLQPSINGSNSSQTITIQQQNSFEINGAENPQTTGNIVSNTLNDQINASILQQQANN